MKMEGKRWFPCLLLAVSAVFLSASPLNAGIPQEPILVGHISHIEGKLFRYVPAEEIAEADWVLIRKDAPLGTPDILYTDRASRAEFIFPNNAQVRIDSSTQIDVVAIVNDLTVLYMTAGTGRFHNKSSETASATIRVETAFGYVMGPAKTTFDLRVGEESMELTVLRGTVAFVHVADGEEQRYEVGAESFTLRADNRHVETSAWDVDNDWNDWNRRRDALWAQRAMTKVEYLPRDLDTYAYIFDAHGTWERIYYDGARRFCWRPSVAIGWSPFRRGRWTVWFGTHVWIPFEPFGYVTHHYGNWILTEGRWYWAPPRHWRHRRIASRTHWHPGRVGWMHSGLHIGWYPLSPLEIYYGNRRWGPYTRVVTQRPPHRHKKRDAYFKNGIIVKKTDLYEAKEGGYTPVKDRHAIIKDARPISIIDRTIIRRTEHRHRYADGEPERKPHKAVIKRIQHRKAKIGKTAPLRVSELKQKLRRIRKGRLRKGNGGIKAPVVIDRIVARSDIDTSDVTFRVVKPRRERMKGIPRPIVEAKKRPLGKIMKKPPPRKPEAGRPVDGKKRRMEKTRQDKEHHRKARTEAEKRRPVNARKRPKQIIKADDEEENSSKKTRKDEKPGKSKKPEVNAEEEQKTQEAPLEKHKKRSTHWP